MGMFSSLYIVFAKPKKGGGWRKMYTTRSQKKARKAEKELRSLGYKVKITKSASLKSLVKTTSKRERVVRGAEKVQRWAQRYSQGRGHGDVVPW